MEDSSPCTSTEEDLVDDLPSQTTHRQQPTSSHRIMRQTTTVEPQSRKVQSTTKLVQLGKWLK